VVKYLLDKKSKKGADNNKWLPIYNIAWGGNLEIVKMLAKREGGVNMQTTLRKLPLYLACRQGYLKVVKYLLDKELEEGADNNR